MSNIKLEKLLAQNEIEEISLNEAKTITGSGALTWTGAAVGGLIGGIEGSISYPVGEAWQYLTTGQSDFNVTDWGGAIVGDGAAGAAIGSGFGTAIENLGQ